MKIVIQRVTHGSVEVEGTIVGKIDTGFVVLVGFTYSDTSNIIDKMIHKLINLRIFEDENGKLNLSLREVGGAILSISQFTLYADCKKGRRPSFTDAMNQAEANQLYTLFNQKLLDEGIRVETGRFKEDMKVHILNDGPVTIILDSQDIM